MKNENDGLKFLETAVVIYVFAILFAYSFLTISGSVITGNAVIGVVQNDSSLLQQMRDEESLHNTIYIISVIFLTVLFIWIVAYLFTRKNKNNAKIKMPRYRAFKTH